MLNTSTFFVGASMDRSRIALIGVFIFTIILAIIAVFIGIQLSRQQVAPEESSADVSQGDWVNVCGTGTAELPIWWTQERDGCSGDCSGDGDNFSCSNAIKVCTCYAGEESSNGGFPVCEDPHCEIRSGTVDLNAEFTDDCAMYQIDSGTGGSATDFVVWRGDRFGDASCVQSSSSSSSSESTSCPLNDAKSCVSFDGGSTWAESGNITPQELGTSYTVKLVDGDDCNVSQYSDSAVDNFRFNDNPTSDFGVNNSNNGLHSITHSQGQYPVGEYGVRVYANGFSNEQACRDDITIVVGDGAAPGACNDDCTENSQCTSNRCEQGKCVESDFNTTPETTCDLTEYLANGCVCPAEEVAFACDSLAANPVEIEYSGGTVTLTASITSTSINASDITYTYGANEGTVSGNGSTATWELPGPLTGGSEVSAWVNINGGGISAGCEDDSCAEQCIVTLQVTSPDCGDGVCNDGENCEFSGGSEYACDNGSLGTQLESGSCRTTSCTYCGDGTVNGDEECEIGDVNSTTGQTCTSSCVWDEVSVAATCNSSCTSSSECPDGMTCTTDNVCRRTECQNAVDCICTGFLDDTMPRAVIASILLFIASLILYRSRFILNLGFAEKLAKRMDVEYSYLRGRLSADEYREEKMKLKLEERFKKRETSKEHR